MTHLAGTSAADSAIYQCHGQSPAQQGPTTITANRVHQNCTAKECLSLGWQFLTLTTLTTFNHKACVTRLTSDFM